MIVFRYNGEESLLKLLLKICVRVQLDLEIFGRVLNSCDFELCEDRGNWKEEWKDGKQV